MNRIVSFLIKLFLIILIGIFSFVNAQEINDNKLQVDTPSYEDRVKELIEEALTNYTDGNLELALVKYNFILKLLPENSLFYYNRAIVNSDLLYYKGSDC